ncbi:transketolase [Tepidimicrobium xylanilyticum]|uniref:transketolase n=1 Tax=Tepidimicrobium xylanilyticum TaxID=1123352 RepID=UPI00264CF188|nr:transketolase [Tepidimicrobium xylanilyticum]GMG96755.1 transketolase [Tepidimicrobium xylanilyticum]
MENYSYLENVAKKIRISIIEMLKEAKSGHPGGSLSAAEILTALYFKEMNVDPKNPKWADRDRFVLSKGHAAPVLYAALAEKGYFPKEELYRLRKIDSMLQGHPDMKGTPGVDMTTGSLGQGLAVANGMALAGKLDGRDYRVYVLIGDGECQEGIIWEAAMLAAHYKLDNITVFLDHNGLQIDGANEEVMDIEPIDEKFKSFGWHVMKIDGHSFEAIFKALDEAKNIKGKPSIIIAKTVKGKGVSFMENVAEWHGKAPNEEETLKALEELGGGING